MQKLKTKIPVRSYTGEKWKTNRTNKKYLSIDFDNRCAYCDDLDKYNGGYNTYQVEHFAPKEKFPSLRYTYDNLLYACPYCNRFKSNKWPSDNPNINVVGNVGFLDPCCKEYYEHLYRDDDGSIRYNSELGKYIYEELNLGLKRHRLLFRQVELNELIKKTQAKIIFLEKQGKDVSELKDILLPLLEEYVLCTNGVNEE